MSLLMLWNTRRTSIKKINDYFIDFIRRRGLIIIILLSAAVILLVFGAILSYEMPPLENLVRSRLALSRARQVSAAIYAPKQFFAAEDKWKTSMREWRYQNQRAFFRRDFKKLQNLADATYHLAIQSKNRAIRVQDSLKNVAQIEMTLLQDKIINFKKTYNQVPIPKLSRSQFNKAELLILESHAALKRKDYKKAVYNLNFAESLIGKVGKEAEKKLNSYLYELPKWRQWAQQTIAWSKDSNDVAIVIDKLAHICQVYNSGQLIKEYAVELGSNWIGHKRLRGDNATPEGKYFITKKVDSGRSKYYKALVINYPNETDQENFLVAKEQGEIPMNAQIGGLIEIHGDGGKGTNWTQGCIALRNEDLDKIFNLVEVGTPVTIVGSMKGLNNHVNASK